MHHRDRVLTVAEARALPPPALEDIEDRRHLLAELLAEFQQAQASGKLIPESVLDWALDDRDDECEDGSPVI